MSDDKLRELYCGLATLLAEVLVIQERVLRLTAEVKLMLEEENRDE